MGIPNEGGFARSDVAGENELRDGEKSRGRSEDRQGESRIGWGVGDDLGRVLLVFVSRCCFPVIPLMNC